MIIICRWKYEGLLNKKIPPAADIANIKDILTKSFVNYNEC